MIDVIDIPRRVFEFALRRIQSYSLYRAGSRRFHVNTSAFGLATFSILAPAVATAITVVHIAMSPSTPASLVSSGRPLAGEFASYAADDIAYVAGDDARTALAAQRDSVLALLSPLTDDVVDGVTYAPGKWMLKDVVAHLADDERIFAYRLLCVARRDPRVLDGFDEREYAEAAEATRRPWTSILSDYAAVRQATLTLLDGLPREAWQRRGIVNGYEASVRGLAFHIAGHELRHIRAIETLYWPRLNLARNSSG